MSRIGKNPITIPQEVTISIDDGVLTVKGPKGELKREFRDEISFLQKDGVLELKLKRHTRLAPALWGTYASHIQNMIEGVTKGFQKKLIIEGVGYRAELQGSKLVLLVGYSHPVEVEAPEGISFSADKNSVTVSGIDKELVGQTAAKIRQVRKPEPYKGKGIRYDGEVIRRKAGKKAVGVT